METQKRRRGDRKDGRLLRELDSLHFITGIIYPNRCDNEAYVSERIDLTAMNAYLAACCGSWILCTSSRASSTPTAATTRRMSPSALI